MTQTVVSTDQTWRPLKVGGGGFVTKIDIHPDGTIVTGTDTNGGYVRRPGDTKWTQLCTAYTFPSDEVDYAGAIVSGMRGFYEIRVAPSDSDIMYCVYDGKIFRSADGGATWVRRTTGFPAYGSSQTNPDAKVGVGSRTYDPYMAIDPVNPDVVYCGNGYRLYRTLDGGLNWSACSGISDANNLYPGVGGLVIDPSSSNSSTPTRKSVIMVWVHNRGWYRSTNGGDSFSLLGIAGPGWPDNTSTTILGSASRISQAECNANGVVIASDSVNVWRYSGGVWTNIGGSGAYHVTIDPFSPNRAVIVQDNGRLMECTNITAGSPTWSGPYTGALDGLTIPWPAQTSEEDYLASGPARFSPAIQNRLYIAQGVGVWYVDLSPGFSSATWKNFTDGIENLVGIEVRKFAGNKRLYLSCYDRALFVSGNPEAYATTSNAPLGPPGSRGSLRWGACVAAPDNNSDMILSLVQFGNARCGISTDQGDTWTALGLPKQYYSLVIGFDCVSTTNGSPTVTISGVTHGLSTGNYIAFTRMAAIGGVSLAGKVYQVTVSNSTTFTITYATNATSTVTNGGKNVLFTAGSTFVASNAFSCVDGEDLVTFTVPVTNDSRGTSIGSKWYFYGTSTIGGLDIEGEQTVVEVVGTGVFKFAPGGTANATVAAGGGANVPFYSDWPKGTVAPSTHVVCSTATNWIMVGGAARLPPNYTTDGGVTWAECTFPSELDFGGWSFSYYQQRNIIDSDPNVPSTFYAFHYSGGTYKSTDGGANFTLMNSDNFSTHSLGNWHTQLTCVPGHAGHLFWSSGSIAGTGSSDVSGRLMFSTDGGTNWNFAGVATLGGADNGEIKEPNWVSIGAVKPGSSYPTIWMSGWIDGVYGIYYCTDASPTTTGKWTWNAVEAHPMGWMDFMTGMQADPDIWHTCYLSFNGMGYAYTTQTDVTKRTFEITTY